MARLLRLQVNEEGLRRWAAARQAKSSGDGWYIAALVALDRHQPESVAAALAHSTSCRARPLTGRTPDTGAARSGAAC